FREYIQTPVLTNIRITSPGFETYDVQPLNQPDLLAQRPIILFGKWRGPVTGAFELQGKTGRADYLTRLEVSSVQPEESNRALRYLWARGRIAELSDYGFGTPSDDKVKEITSLGLKYNLLTQYTSFIAVREKITNTGQPAEDVQQPLPLPVGVSDLAVESEPEFVWLLAGVLGFGLMVLLWSRRRVGHPRGAVN
ncbi:MAG TPA: hypothetical protein VKD91_13600, partial [Pyrinomonadaceae bacterium]|nr:hypothetical protein [Pyrinomonadaceae bacterium]